MPVSAEELGLLEDEIALHFAGDGGVDAAALGRLLQRVATVARREGANLDVMAIRPGSLNVVLKVVHRAKNELSKNPVAVSAAVMALVLQVCDKIEADIRRNSPLATAAAELIIENNINNIEIVAHNKNIILMNNESARRIVDSIIPEKKSTPTSQVISSLSQAVRRIDMDTLSARAVAGLLIGDVLLVNGELHFRPDGYKYLVPIEFAEGHLKEMVSPGDRILVNGTIKVKGNYPESIFIFSMSSI